MCVFQRILSAFVSSYFRNVLICRYNAEIEDAKYKIHCFSEQELLIPEHPDITAEVDKLEEQDIVELMMEIEAIYERKYGDNKANKVVL